VSLHKLGGAGPLFISLEKLRGAKRGARGRPVRSGAHGIRLTPGPGSPVAQTCDGGAV